MITPKSIFLFIIFLFIEGNMVLAKEIVKYSPVNERIIDSKAKQLNAEDIEYVEKNYGLDKGIDGNKTEFSTLEKRLYASIAFVDNAKSVLDGIYFYELNLLIGGENSTKAYSTGLNTLIDQGKANMGLSVAQINGATQQAQYDYLFKHDPNAAQLIKDLIKSKIKGDAYVQAIWQCWQNPSLESRNKVLELAKALVPGRPPFPTATYSAFMDLCEKPLDDGKLYQALLDVRVKWSKGEDYKAVQLE